MGKGVNGKGKEPRGEEGGEISWYEKGIKIYYLNKIFKWLNQKKKVIKI